MKTETSGKEVTSVNATNKPCRLPTVKSQRDLDAESDEKNNPTLRQTSSIQRDLKSYGLELISLLGS